MTDERLFKFLDSIPDVPNDDRGKEFKGKCKLCGGEIVAIRSTYNGHIHARCNGCGFKLLE